MQIAGTILYTMQIAGTISVSSRKSNNKVDTIIIASKQTLRRIQESFLESAIQSAMK